MLDPDGSAPPTPPDVVLPDLACSGCSYNLRGLPLTGACPECSAPVADSLRARSLPFAAPHYRATLLAGLNTVLTGLLLLIGVTIAQAAVHALALGRAAAAVSALAELALTLVFAIGYWRYTTPDPGFAFTEQPRSARAVARAAAVVSAVASLVTSVISLVYPIVNASIAAGNLTPLTLIAATAGITGVIAWLVQFFAVLTYTAWLADRIPDPDLARRARRYRWLIPVLYLVLSCVLIGPLVAFIMYWVLLSAVRNHLRNIALAPALHRGPPPPAPAH
jgi:hypothetical protein